MSGRNVSMQFGKRGEPVQPRPGLKYIKSGSVVNSADSVIFEFTPGGMYILVSDQWTTSDGTRQGRQVSLICAPEDSKFGTTAPTREALVTGGTARVSYTLNTNSTLTVVRNGTAYSWRYALYRVDG